MNYEKIYYQIIERSKTRHLEGYKEKHHVIPKCMGGSNEKENIVELTAREHFLCHCLLVEIYPLEQKLKYAVWTMATGFRKSKNSNFKTSSKTYERLKILFSNSIKGKPKPIGFMSLETRIKISKSNIGRISSMKDKTHSIDTLIKMSKSRKKMVMTEERNKNISNSMLGKLKTEEHKLNMSICRLGKSTKRCKPVLQYDLEENFIKEWNKIKEASIFFNKPKDTSSITMCCLGKQKTAFGFKWKYKNEILKRNE